MKDSPDTRLDQWIRRLRDETPPAPSREFTDSVMHRIDAADSGSKRPRLISVLLRIAAILIAGAVGFLRLELIFHFLILSS